MFKMIYPTFSDSRGDLLPIEFKTLPFVPERLFVVKNVPIGCRRGEHAHFKTLQYLICLKGSIKVVLHDGMSSEEQVIQEGESVFINSFIWDYQEFLTGNDVLLVLCSTEFDIEDYIQDFNEFKRIKQTHNG